MSTGNIAGDERVALIAELVVPRYRAIVEQAVVVTVVAFDWNCPQHITPRYSEPELDAVLAPIRAQLRDAATGA